jgi:hypothetical protein
MGNVKALRCPKCGAEAASRTVFQCAKCRTILEVDVNIDHLKPADWETMRRNRDPSIWRRQSFLEERYRFAHRIAQGPQQQCRPFRSQRVRVRDRSRDVHGQRGGFRGGIFRSGWN